MAGELMIELVRCDRGTGGWSLHCHVLDADVAGTPDEFPVLVSGPGRMVRGEWTRPAERHWARARRLARELARQGRQVEGA